jgi:cytochrome c peroxidase
LCVTVTEPYFHDGSAATLWDVVDHYNNGDAGSRNLYLDEDIQPVALREGERESRRSRASGSSLGRIGPSATR